MVTFNLKSKWQDKPVMTRSEERVHQGEGVRTLNQASYMVTETKRACVAGAKQERERELRNEVGDLGKDQGT